MLQHIWAKLVSSTGVLFHQLYSNDIVNSILIFSRNRKVTIFYSFAPCGPEHVLFALSKCYHALSKVLSVPRAFSRACAKNTQQS